MKRTLMMTAAFLFAGQMAFAALSTDTVVSELKGQGYTRIEIKTGPTQMKVEAIRGTEKLEIVYDIETGAVLKKEIGEVYQGENTTPGVQISKDNDDFIDGDDNKDDSADGNDDNDDNSGNDDNDDGDDDHGGNSGGTGSDND